MTTAAGDPCPFCRLTHIGPCMQNTPYFFQSPYPQGWVCPKCGTPYGPNTPECWRCAAPPVVSSTVSASSAELTDEEKEGLQGIREGMNR